jgi:hypothetical protein
MHGATIKNCHYLIIMHGMENVKCGIYSYVCFKRFQKFLTRRILSVLKVKKNIFRNSKFVFFGPFFIIFRYLAALEPAILAFDCSRTCVRSGWCGNHHRMWRIVLYRSSSLVAYMISLRFYWVQSSHRILPFIVFVSPLPVRHVESLSVPLHTLAKPRPAHETNLYASFT